MRCINIHLSCQQLDQLTVESLFSSNWIGMKKRKDIFFKRLRLYVDVHREKSLHRMSPFWTILKQISFVLQIEEVLSQGLCYTRYTFRCINEILNLNVRRSHRNNESLSRYNFSTFTIDFILLRVATKCLWSNNIFWASTFEETNRWTSTLMNSPCQKLM